MMNQQAAAIIIAGALIAGAIALTNHWTLVVSGTDANNRLIMRMNPWSGTIAICDGIAPGWEIPCPPPRPMPQQTK